MPKLTKRAIDYANTTGRDLFLWDGELPLFGVRIKKSGVKSFVVQYRNAKGRSKRFTLGRYGVFTVEEARKEARIVLADVAKGSDPAETKKLERGAMTMTELCREYLDKAERGLILKRNGDSKRSTTLYTDKGRIERHIVPLLGNRTVKDLTPIDVRRFMNNVINGKSAADVKTKKRGRAIVTGGSGTAGRTMGLLGGILTYAVQEGYRPDNPARGIVRPKDRTRKWRLDDAGYRRLGQCLRAAESNGEPWQRVFAVRAAALTGCRLEEIEGLPKTEIDVAGSALRKEWAKSGPIRPLGSAALGVLKKASARSNSKFVFPSITDPKKHHTGLTRWLKKIAGKAVPGITSHGLRHSFSSIANDLGFSLPTIKGLIGHSATTVTEGYIYPIDRALVVAADQVARHIDALMRDQSSAPSTSA
jgi:integrase